MSDIVNLSKETFMKTLNALLVTALIAPLLMLTGCGSCGKSDDCYDKTNQTYSK